MREGIADLLREKTRKLGLCGLCRPVLVERIDALTLSELSGAATH
jgi:hypothetical protein